MLIVCRLRKHFVQIAIDVLARNDRSHIHQIPGSSRHFRFAGQDQHWLITVREIKHPHLRGLELHISCGSDILVRLWTRGPAALSFCHPQLHLITSHGQHLLQPPLLLLGLHLIRIGARVRAVGV